MKKVLVVGDTILDHYVHGTVSRVNPEAPYSVVLDYSKEDVKLGGAANVAANIKSVLGDDAMVHYYGAASEQVASMFSTIGVSIPYITHPDDDMLIKTRYICQGKYLLRVDRGNRYEFGEDFDINLAKKLVEYDYDLIVISDYNKGTITKERVRSLLMSGKKVVFDLKKAKNYAPTFRNKENLIVKCNNSEFESEVNSWMIKEVKAVIQTVGEDGAIVHCDDRRLKKLPLLTGEKTDTADVVGAGDAFLTGMVYACIKWDHWDAERMADVGNEFAAVKVRKFGTHILTPGEVGHEI